MLVAPVELDLMPLRVAAIVPIATSRHGHRDDGRYPVRFVATFT